MRGADPHAGPFLEERARLVGLVQRAGHENRVGRRLEGLREAARRIERRPLGQPRADGRELEQRDRSGVHRVAQARGSAGRRRLSDGLPSATNRHGTETHGSPAYAMPMRGVATIAGAGSSSGRASRRSLRRRIAQVDAGARAVDVERGRDEARAGGEGRAIHGADGPAGRAARAAAAHRADALDGLDGADEHGGGRAARAR